MVFCRQPAVKIRKVLSPDHFSLVLFSGSESLYWNASKGYVHVIIRIPVLRTFLRLWLMIFLLSFYWQLPWEYLPLNLCFLAYSVLQYRYPALFSSILAQTRMFGHCYLIWIQSPLAASFWSFVILNVYAEGQPITEAAVSCSKEVLTSHLTCSWHGNPVVAGL